MKKNNNMEVLFCELAKNIISAEQTENIDMIQFLKDESLKQISEIEKLFNIDIDDYTAELVDEIKNELKKGNFIIKNQTDFYQIIKDELTTGEINVEYIKDALKEISDVNEFIELEEILYNIK